MNNKEYSLALKAHDQTANRSMQSKCDGASFLMCAGALDGAVCGLDDCTQKLLPCATVGKYVPQKLYQYSYKLNCHKAKGPKAASKTSK